MANYEVQRSTTIQAEPEDVYSKIVDFREWASWSPWEDLDPNMTKTYSGSESGAGSSYAWKGNRKVGEGSMKMTEAEAPRRVVIDLQFLKPFKSQSVNVFELEPTDHGTAVSWVMSGPHSAMTRVFSMFKSMDDMVGKDFEKGLAQLKTVSESPTD